MASITDICNRALQKVGAPRITSISDSTPSARACNDCYAILRRKLYKMYAWKFAIKMTQLTADGTAPAFGREASFTLPADYISILPPFEGSNFEGLDWVVQGGKIYSDNDDELDLRYVADIETASLMDPLYVEALASLMAVELCEILTQSNTKKAALVEDFKDCIAEAKRGNSFESVAIVSPDTTWVTIRDS